MTDIERVLGMCPETESRRRYLEQFTRRMGDFAVFIRSLKQRFSRWHNGRNRRKGTLWEDRYRSVAVEIQDLATFGHAARIVAAYIDLNPVRAGMVEDPKDYEWSGYGRAVRGEKSCVLGVVRLWGRQRGVKGAMAEYRVFLFEEGTEKKTEDRRERTGGKKKGKIQDPRTGEWKTRVGIDARKVWEERKRGGRLPLQVILRLKLRYLVDGAAIGSAEFLRRLTGKSEVISEPATARAEPSDTSGTTVEESGREGVALRFGQWGGLRALRDLRVGVVG